MTRTQLRAPRVRDDEFGSFLTSSLEAGGLGRPVSWRTAPHRRRSSFRLDSVDVVLEGGEQIAVVCKSTSAASIAPIHRDAKPAWRHHPHREAWCYQHLLPPLDAGTARCYGVDPSHRWLLLEAVPGHPLAETADPAAWDRAVRWLAQFHLTAAAEPDAPLLRRDAHHVERSWVATMATCDWDRAARLASLGPVIERAVEVLMADTQVVVHGEWFPTNILVDPPGGRICPVDWEQTAVGSAALDLAAFTTGWSEPDAQRFVELYRQATGVSDGEDSRALRRSWAAARIVGAIDHLGSRARPPIERDFDWWGELTHAVDDFGMVDR